ncbi:hypothetical protein LJC27_08445, partial [Christensenellaceae bacterium OttesenSCG-928-M15]|nr:hypothetical protein [Christensenellaceae bacterium OttesenSCG-928-M15]
MARRRRGRGRQTRHKQRRINWGRFIIFLLIVVGIAAAILLAIHLLSGDESPILPSSTPTPAAGLGSPLPEVSATPSPTPHLSGELSLNPAEGTDPSGFGYKSDIMIDGEIVTSFTRSGNMSFGHGKDYTALPGLITFGGSNYRDTFTYGTANVKEKKLEIVHTEEMGYLNGWSGTCWTGMPVIVEWPAQTRKVLGVKDEFKDKDGFTEIIYVAADGYIYFLEMPSGKRTRDPIKLGVTTKGTASLDPRGYPLLYTGQGDASTNANGKSGAWFRIVDLIQNKVVYEFGQKDPFSHRDWQAYDSSALLHAQTDTLIAPGENGVLYTLKLNSQFDPEAGTVSVTPDKLQKYRYLFDGYSTGSDDSRKRWLGIENSISVFRNYAYFTD